MDANWDAFFEGERGKSYYAQLMDFVADAYEKGVVYPPHEKIFAAFETTPFERVKVVILGQDPYHEPGQAEGLAFSVPEGVVPPPSLVNIAKELKAEREGLDAAKIKAGEVVVPDLRDWARQGVLLLNATLTVAAGEPMSHRGRGWEIFTDAAVRFLAEHRHGLVFMLWGAHAQKKGAFVDRARHCAIECAHPSPLSARRGFFGSRCFELCNEYLKQKGETICW